ncbi:MAG TPA: peptidylprolyl isomerase [Thermoanaerobaculia bacterium]|nr:peptidylprolyl isomerase [Thermoanaerobaculia bacterium]
MRQSRPASHSQILCLSIVFLLTGLLGCSRGSRGEQPASGAAAAAGGKTTAPASATPADAKTAAPASAAPTGTTAPPGAAAGSPSQPGAAAPASSAPAAAAPAPAALPPEKLPAVVAKVNGQAINKDELLKVAKQASEQMSRQTGAPPTPSADFYRKVLDNIVARTLLLQEARTQGVVVTDDEAKAQVADLRSKFPDPAAFAKVLKENGMTEDELLREAKDAYAVQRFIETKVLADLKVSDEQAKAFYDKNQDQMKRPERVHLRHILIKSAKDAKPEDKAKAKAKAEELLAKAKAGGDFAKLASESSEDDPGSKTRGGDLSWVTRGSTVEPFEKAAFALTKPNELSPVVETQFGYHVIQLLERQPPGITPFPDVKDQIAAFLKRQQSQEKVQAYVEILRAKAKGKIEVFI